LQRGGVNDRFERAAR